MKKAMLLGLLVLIGTAPAVAQMHPARVCPLNTGCDVSSVNSLTGDLTLAAGNNVTLTVTGKTFSFAAGAGNCSGTASRFTLFDALGCASNATIQADPSNGNVAFGNGGLLSGNHLTGFAKSGTPFDVYTDLTGSSAFGAYQASMNDFHGGLFELDLTNLTTTYTGGDMAALEITARTASTDTQDYNWALRGAYIKTEQLGSGHVAGMEGLRVEANYYAGTAPTNGAFAITSGVFVNGAGNAAATGHQSYMGLYGSGTLTNVIGHEVQMDNEQAAGNVYGFKYTDASGGFDVAPTNRYGFYDGVVGHPGATLDYSFYGLSKGHFNGALDSTTSVGVGTATWTVSSAALATGCVDASIHTITGATGGMQLCVNGAWKVVPFTP